MNSPTLIFPPLPLSFHSTSELVLRRKGDSRTISYERLGCIAHEVESVKLVSVHALPDGNYGVSVDAIQTMKVYTPDQFEALIIKHTQLDG